jgi:hypothetical protein
MAAGSKTTENTNGEKQKEKSRFKKEAALK